MSDTGYSHIKVEMCERRGRITLNRPDKRNPLDWDTIKECRMAVANFEQNPALATVVVTGSGEAFSAGGDLEKYIALFEDGPGFRGFMDDFYLLFRAMRDSRLVYIAGINGVCVAGGLELLLACDLVVASERARIGDAHLNFGQLPGAGSSIRLWRSVGVHRAKHLMLSGDILSAEQAQRIGLVNEVFDEAAFDRGIIALVEKIEQKSPAGVRGAKWLLNEAVDLDLEGGLRAEMDYVHKYATTERDPREGLRAFMEKRTPRFGS